MSRVDNKEVPTSTPDGANTGDVNSASQDPEAIEKVVQEKLVYYCSSFDLNVNEWFTEYENTEIFKRRMKLKLGANWVKYFYQAIEITQIIESDNDNDSEDFWSEETEDMMSNHCLNVAIEYYLISAKTKVSGQLLSNITSFCESLKYFVIGQTDF